MNCKVGNIKIDAVRTNTETYRAALTADTIKRILAEQICSERGLGIDAPNTRVTVQLSSRMGNYETEYEALVTVTIDHAKSPAALEI